MESDTCRDVLCIQEPGPKLSLDTWALTCRGEVTTLLSGKLGAWERRTLFANATEERPTSAHPPLAPEPTRGVAELEEMGLLSFSSLFAGLVSSITSRKPVLLKEQAVESSLETMSNIKDSI